jgi:hypothetical protein
MLLYASNPVGLVHNTGIGQDLSLGWCLWTTLT